MRPNLPLQPSADTTRRHAQAINSLLGRPSYLHLTIAGKPAAAATIVLTQFPVPLTLLSDGGLFKASVAATGSPVFDISVNGSTIGTITFSGTTGTLALTGSEIPENTEFLITAPSPQDATLADITLSLAVSR